MNYTLNEIIKDPNTKTTIYRVLETNPERDQVRLVRTGKDGTIHGLVKKTQGEWVPTSQLEGYQVIGTFSGSTKKTTKMPKQTSVKVGEKHAPRPSISSHSNIASLLENFQRSKADILALADGLRELVS